MKSCHLMKFSLSLLALILEGEGRTSHLLLDVKHDPPHRLAFVGLAAKEDSSFH